jgi:hypothetical protein
MNQSPKSHELLQIGFLFPTKSNSVSLLLIAKILAVAALLLQLGLSIQIKRTNSRKTTD